MNDYTWDVRSNQNGTSELIHHGILGMKWGVRRTPEQLGHKKAQKALKAQGALAKYKTKNIQKINKLYDKSINRIKEGLEYDPDNKDLKKELKKLNYLKKQDISKIEKMSYTDVVNEKAAIKKARRDKAASIAKTVAKGTIETTLWAARMGLVGLKAYGLFKGVQVVAELGNNAIEWLQSPEGQAFVNKGYNTINTFITAGDKVAKLTNPNIANYVDSKALADKITSEAVKYGKQEIERQFGKENIEKVAKYVT